MKGFQIVLLVLCFFTSLLQIEKTHAATEFGITTNGTTNYPNSGLKKLGNAFANNDWSNISTGFLDGNGFAYYGTYDNPASIIKIQTSTMTEADRLNLSTPSSQTNLAASAIDTTGTYGYFASGTTPSKLYKVKLSDLTLVNSLSLGGASGPANHIIIDPTGTSAYISTNDSPAKIIKVNLSSFTITSTLTLNGGEDKGYALTLDTTNGKLYMGTYTSPAQVVKIDVGTFTRESSITLADVGSDFITTGFLKAANNTLYFATDTAPSRIVRVNTSTFTETPSPLDLNANEDWVYYSFYNSTSDKAYFSSVNGYLVEVDLGSFTRTNGVSTTGNYIWGDTLFDSTNGKAIISAPNTPAQIIKMNLATLTEDMVLTLPASADGNVHMGTIDEVNGYAYHITQDTPNKLLKYNVETNLLEDILIFTTPGSKSEGNPVVDTVRNKLYVGVNGSITDPHGILKIDLATFTEEDFVNTGTIRPDSKLVADSSFNYLYGASRSGSFAGGAVKINLATFTLEDSVSLGDDGWTASAINDTGTHVYFGNESTYGMVKIATNTMTVEQNVAFPDSINTILFDPVDALLYATGEHAGGTGAKIHMVSPNDLSIISTLTLPVNDKPVYSGDIDVAKRRLYLGLGWPGKIIVIDLLSFSASAILPLASFEEAAETVDIDFNRGYLTSGIYTYPTNMAKFAISQKGQVLATKITLTETANVINSLSFYSHAASGNLRLALYNSNNTRLWQSGSIANNKTNDWVTVQVSAGSPSTLSNLSAGEYWVAFQTDSNTDIASYSLGGANTGKTFVQTYGSFPASISDGISTTENWAMYVTYNQPLVGGGTTSATEDLNVSAIVTEALIMSLDKNTISLQADPSVNNGKDASEYSQIQVATNSLGGYSVYTKLDDGTGTARLTNGNGSYITSGTDENNFGFEALNAGYSSGENVDADAPFSNIATLIASNALTASYNAPSNNRSHTIYYDLDVDYTTPSGTYTGIITYTVAGNF